MGKIRIARALLSGVLVTAAFPAGSQTGTQVPGGLQLTFGFSERLEYDDNLRLLSTSPGESISATTRLNFALQSETKTERLSLTASTALRGSGGDGVSNPGFNIDDPRFTLNYSRDVGASVLTLGSNYRRSDVQFLRPFTDFLDPNGVFVPPTDLADLTGTGFRTDYGVSGALSLWNTGPFGVTVSAGLAGLTYDQVSNPALADSRTVNIGTDFRLRLSDTTDANVNLGFTQFENLATSNTANSRTLDLGVTRTLPNGSIGASFQARNNAAGDRFGFTVRGNMPTPTGGLNASLGISRPPAGDIGVIGNLGWQYQAPTGNLSAQISRGVSTNSANVDVLNTILSLGYNQPLTPKSGVSLDLSYALTDPSGVGNNTTNTSFGVSYNRAITPDWTMSAGYTYRMRDPETGSSATSNAVFVGLARSFVIRP